MGLKVIASVFTIDIHS